jgi:hypothetical protein
MALSGDIGLREILAGRPELVETVAVEAHPPSVETADDLARLEAEARLGAPSTHPPLTEPAISPPSATASLAPTPRGAEPSTRTTVASAVPRPAGFHARRASSASSIRGPVCDR